MRSRYRWSVVFVFFLFMLLHQDLESLRQLMRDRGQEALDLHAVRARASD